jgi:23S rRNA (guanosine2251-2'-O)-methyltransferase
MATAQALESLEGTGPLSQRWAILPETVERTRIEAVLPASAVHQGMALLAEPLPPIDFEAICEAQSQSRSRVIVLDQVEDPQNVGAILRSAAAFEALAVILTDRNAPPVSGALAKAASGALERVPLCRVPNLGRALERLAELGYWRVGLDAAGEKPLSEVLPGIRHVALVLGAEGAGMRRLTAEKCDYLARLPIAATAESLNVSAAAAIALYEAARV